MSKRTELLPRVSFASDNAAGVHPAVMAAIAEANVGHALGYGEDAWSATAAARFRDTFGETAHVLFVLTGTGANVVGLRPHVDSYHAILCAESSHLWHDECAAPERFLGCKLTPIPTPDGKLTPQAIEPALRGVGIVHRAQPRAISVAQPTEWGTLYSLAELHTLAELAHAHDLVLHVDGARLCNAAAALDVPLAALGAAAGVDVLSFGGTKLGLLAGEAVVLFDAALAHRAAFHRKQSMQLASKMRFVAAQLEAILRDELWRTLAGHANRMARRLADGLIRLPGVELVRPVETNAVFASLPAGAVTRLQQQEYFHLWDPERSIARFMTAWDTRPDDVDALVTAARAIVEREPHVSRP